jgi:hypothetical protein
MSFARKLARIVEAVSGFALGTSGACALIIATLICFAMLLVGSTVVVEYLVYQLAAFEHLAA